MYFCLGPAEMKNVGVFLQAASGHGQEQSRQTSEVSTVGVIRWVGRTRGQRN